jgi:hypothetical protein
MWSQQSPAKTNWSGGSIQPSDVLYYYDGPILFSAAVGLTDFLFYKVEELDGSDLFLITHTTDTIIEAVKKGALSLRGALTNPDYWILDVDAAMQVRRYWSVREEDLPSDFLPEAGLGLYPQNTPVADTIEQASSFFSVKFSGEGLTNKGMPFGIFKGLVDDAYEALKKIFPAPVVNAKSLGRNFDFDILQPRFSSLIIAIREPTVHVESLKADVRKDLDLQAVQKGLQDSRREFFENMSEIVSEAQKGEIKESFASQHFYTLDQVSQILPTETNSIDRVEFRSEAASITQALSIDDRLGVRMRAAHRMAEASEREMTGTVVEINAESATLVIKNAHSRQTTCVFNREAFDKLSISVGSRLLISGEFRRRSRRDLIVVQGPVRVLS